MKHQKYYIWEVLRTSLALNVWVNWFKFKTFRNFFVWGKCIPFSFPDLMWTCFAWKNMKKPFLRYLQTCSDGFFLLLHMFPTIRIICRLVCMLFDNWVKPYWLEDMEITTSSKYMYTLKNDGLWFGLCFWLGTVVPDAVWIRVKFNLKIDRSVTTLRQEFGIVARSYWFYYLIVFLTQRAIQSERYGIIWRAHAANHSA